MKYSYKTKRFLGVLACVLLLLSTFSVTAHAELKDTTKDVTLIIYALETKVGSDVMVDSSVTGEKITLPDKKPIEGVSFALYKTDDDETDTSTPDREPDFKTDLSGEDGCVSIVVPAAQQGRYLVVEDKKPPYAVGRTVPFLVDLPLTALSGSEYLYEVYAYPKQMLLEEDFSEETDTDPSDDSDDDSDKDVTNPSITKQVSEDNGKTWGELANIASISGNKAYWKVSVNVPTSIRRMKIFTVGDVLDKRLEAPNISDIQVSSSGKALDVSAYKANVSGQTITVEFDPSALTQLTNKTVDIIFPTAIKLSEENSVGVLIPNTATLSFTRLIGAPEIDSTDTDIDYTDSDGTPTTTPVKTIKSETPQIWTAAINGFKHDGSNEAVNGAEFTLYSDKDCKNKIAASVSDKSGVFSFVGLHDGTYYLKETKTPDGYQENDKTIEVSVKMKDNKAIQKVDVLNIKKTNLPVTGGAGIIGLSLAGLSLTALGVVFIALAIKERTRSLKASA